MYSLPVTSAICDPSDGDTVGVKDGSIELRGELEQLWELFKSVPMYARWKLGL